ncbi:MAG: hypothetical protein AABZ32_01210, partial [Bacteroidota bacterium]
NDSLASNNDSLAHKNDSLVHKNDSLAHKNDSLAHKNGYLDSPYLKINKNRYCSGRGAIARNPASGWLRAKRGKAILQNWYSFSL